MAPDLSVPWSQPATQPSLTPESEKGNPRPDSRFFPSVKPRAEELHFSALNLTLVVRNSSEMELNPNVLTHLGSDSGEHGPVSGKPELRVPSRLITSFLSLPCAGYEGDHRRPTLTQFTEACWDSRDSSKNGAERTLSNLIPGHISVQQPG